jgi:hypothetical protein
MAYKPIAYRNNDTTFRKLVLLPSSTPTQNNKPGKIQKPRTYKRQNDTTFRKPVLTFT